MHGFIDNDMEDDVVSGAQLGGAQLGLEALLAGRHPGCSGRDPFSQAQRLQVGNIG